MSWTDEEIDDLFREGAETQSFEYDSAYFSEIEAALPVNGKGRDFLWLGTALMFVAVLTTGYFINSDDTDFANANTQLADVKVTKEEDSKTANQNGVASKMTSNTSSNVPMDETSVVTNDATSVSATTNTAPLKQGQSGNSTSAATSTNSNSMYDVATRSVNKKRGSTTSVNPTDLVLEEPNGNQLKVIPATNNTTSVATNQSGEATEQHTELDKAPISASLAVKSPNQLDNQMATNLAPNALPMLSEMRPKAAFYLELNAGASQSLITPSEYSSTSYGGGLGVETYLGNFNLTTGLNLAVSNHKDLTLTTEGKNYSFGSALRKHEYSYNQVYNLDLPINLGYNFGNHNVNLGVRTSVLLGAKIQHSVFDDQEMLRSEKLYGLAGGLKRFAVRPTVGYACRMKNWTVGANIGVQMMQSVNEEYINGLNNRFPIDGQIYLRRSIKLRK
ncbi:MAG: hypothetical protein CSA03_01930 [Bacteroidetes bacterium]|nr:MAG: hypothetical protein CSA03_01930 [Bacteroidota bacterium]